MLFVLVLIAGCGRASGDLPASCPPGAFSSAVNPLVGQQTGQQISAEGKSTLEAYLSAAQFPDLQYPQFPNFRTEAKEFYESSGDSLPWIMERRPSAQARALIQIFQQAENEGLNPTDYDGSRWAGRLLALDSGRAPESELIRFDLAVTISTMRYVSDLHRGRVNPREFHFDLDIENKSIDLSEFLRGKLVNAVDVAGVMRSVEPPFPAYRQTVEALQTYMKMASEDNSDPLPVPTAPVKPGNLYISLPRLKQLLSLLGDSPAGAVVTSDSTYTGALVIAVKHFQKRHGLEPSGVLDAQTFKELNTPLGQRVLQLKLTLERWRWLPHEFAEPPIVVNIPEFRVYAANGEYLPAFSMKVVVGRSYKHQTPVFATEMKSVIFRPYWNVPLDIQRKELLPELRKAPDYLRKHDYEIIDANGAIVGEANIGAEMMEKLFSGKLAIRQRPGPKNSLGLIKFDLPNKYDVYMHDTPATQLFSRSRRDFSHGCIRLEDPVALAKWVLRDQAGWDTEHILSAMNGDKTFRVNLSKPVPVLILYGTATVTTSREVHFFDDIYGLDAVLEQALAKGYPYTTDD